MFYKQRFLGLVKFLNKSSNRTIVFFEILSNIKKNTKQQKLGNLTTNLSNNRNLVTNNYVTHLKFGHKLVRK